MSDPDESLRLARGVQTPYDLRRALVAKLTFRLPEGNEFEMKSK